MTSSPKKCLACGVQTHNTNECWANIEEEENIQSIRSTITVTGKEIKISYALIASKGIPDPKIEKIKQYEEIMKKWSKKHVEPIVNEPIANEPIVNEPIVNKSREKADDYVYIKCKTCSVSFYITPKTVKNYKERNWDMPKICKTCSQKRYLQKKL
jgi:hypothetical protein